MLQTLRDTNQIDKETYMKEMEKIVSLEKINIADEDDEDETRATIFVFLDDY